MTTAPTRRPAILVARPIFPEILARLGQYFEVSDNQSDAQWSRAELIAQLQGKWGAFTTGAEHIDAAVVAACPQLRICANMAVGYDNFDLAAMTAAGVLATNAPDVLTETTADGGFALLMAAARRITEGEHFLRAGRWQRWAYDMLVGQDVHGATLGIFGMGRIGQAIARRGALGFGMRVGQDVHGATLGIFGMGRIGQAIARRGALGFGMRVIYHNRNRLPEAVEQSVGGARLVGRDELLRSADHVMLVLPLTPETHHLIGAPELALMKPTATLVNIGRGGVVDDVALAAALRAGSIAAAGLDVFEGEPHVHADLLACSNVVLTPHIASATARTRLAMANLAADNLVGYLIEGRAPTALNPEVIGRVPAR